MKFGYVWNDHRAISVLAQREYLDAVDADMRKVLIERSPSRDKRHDLLFDGKPLLRSGDVLCVYRTRYLADDTLDFISVLAALANIGARLHVIQLGVEFLPDPDTAHVMSADVAERHKAQTAEATKAWKKLPKAKRGGRQARQFDAEEKKKFKAMWANKTVTLGDMAEVFECSKPSIVRYAERMKLPPRGA